MKPPRPVINKHTIMETSINVALELSLLDNRHETALNAQDHSLELEPEQMKSWRGEKNEVKGYMMKTAQSLSAIQRKHFYRRYYELDVARKVLKIFEKKDGALKEELELQNVTHVVTELITPLRIDYKTFFSKKEYKNVSIELPKEFASPFVVFTLHGDLMVFWTASNWDFSVWTEAFRSLIDPQFTRQSVQTLSGLSYSVPLPQPRDDNYFVTSLYLCLLPQNLTRTDIDQLETHRQDPRQDAMGCHREVGPKVEVSEKYVKGYLYKTVQSEEVFSKKTFLKRYFYLDALSSTLSVFKSHLSSDSSQCVAFREKALVHVESRLIKSAKIPQKYVPESHSEPFGLTFADGSVMLLWAQPGKEHKIWTRAFKRFVSASGPHDWTKAKVKTIVWSHKSENSLVLWTLRNMLATQPLQYHLVSQEQAKAAEGWLCLTSESTGGETDRNFQSKAYCVLDLEIAHMVLYDKFNGKEAMKIALNDLRYVETKLTDVVSNKVMHPAVDVNHLSSALEPPQAFRHPFALFSTHGRLYLFWAATKEEAEKWKTIYSRLIPAPDSGDFVNYVALTRQGTFLTALYLSLLHESTEEDTHNPALPKILPPAVEKQAVQEQESNASDGVREITGWLTLTRGEPPQQNTGAYSYSYFTLDMVSGLLTEHKNQYGVVQRLSARILLRKIFWVETNLSNQFRAETKLRSPVIQSLLSSHGLSIPPANATLPAENQRPICLHLVDGDLLLFWASAKREYQKWLAAFQKLMLPQHPDDTIRILVQPNPKNCYGVSVFLGIKPREPLIAVQQAPRVESNSLIEGCCFKTARQERSLNFDYFYPRYYRISVAERELSIRKTKTGRACKQYDLNDLAWVDASITGRFVEGFRAVFEKVGIRCTTESYLPTPFPLALGFFDGTLLIYWFSSPDEHTEVSEVMTAIQRSNRNTDWPGRNIILQTRENLFQTFLYFVLRPLRDSVVHGSLGVFRKNKFVCCYAQLDTVTGTLRLFTSERSECTDEHDLGQAVALTDLDQSQRQLQLGRGQALSLRPNQRVFALHNGDRCFLFAANDLKSYELWQSAFEKVTIPQFKDFPLWVEAANQDPVLLSILQQLSPKVACLKPEGPFDSNFKGYLSTTEQWIGQVDLLLRKQFYSIDSALQQLLASDTEDSRVTPMFALHQLVEVDDTLNCQPDLSLFKEFVGSKKSKVEMAQLGEFTFPVCLLFCDGSIELLWAPSAEARRHFAQSLQYFAPRVSGKHQLFIRDAKNHFVSSFYMCLMPEPPSLLYSIIASQTVEKRVQLPEAPLQSDLYPAIEAKERELVEAMFSAKVVIDGWLFKTAQKFGFMQIKFFFKRFYRLNLMSQELSIYESPFGSAKQTLKLKGLVTRVESDLDAQADLAGMKAYPEQIASNLPSKFPFYVQTIKDCFLLWANTKAEKEMWVQAFEQVMLNTDDTLLGSQVKRTNSNRFVIDLYGCLRSFERKTSAVIQGQRPPGTLQMKQPISNSAMEAKPPISDPRQDLVLSQRMPSGNFPESSAPLTETSELPEPTFHADSSVATLTVALEKQKVAKNELAQKTSTDQETRIANVGREQDRDDPITFLGKVLRKDQKRQRKLAIQRQQTTSETQAKNQPDEKSERIEAIREARDAEEAKRVIETDHRDEGDRQGLSEHASVRYFEKEARCERENSWVGEQPGRKSNLSQLSQRVSRGPIVIKRLIPLKDNTQDDNNKSVQRQSLTDIAIQKLNQVENPAECFLKPIKDKREGFQSPDVDSSMFLRKMPSVEVTEPRKIRIKVRGKSDQRLQQPRATGLASSRSALASEFKKSNQNGQLDFEERVKYQIDSSFIENLIRGKTKTKRSDKQSAWDQIAVGLRREVKAQLQGQTERVKQDELKLSEQPSITRSIRLPLNKKQSGTVGPQVEPQQKRNKATDCDQPQTMRVMKESLSDWDDSDSENQSVQQRGRKASIVNIRDRTSALANVYAGRPLTPSQFPNSLIKTKAINTSRVDNQAAANENDCLAESYRSVWD